MRGMLRLRKQDTKMSKSLVTQIMQSITDSGMEFKILNTMNEKPQHVRITGFGDVYPATGTWQDSRGGWHRRDPRGFFSAISRKPTPKALKIDERVVELEEYCAHLEMEISKIKTALAANSITLW